MIFDSVLLAMPKELAVSLNIVLDRDLVKKIRAVQKELNESYTELRDYDTSPHLAITTKFIVPKQVEKYVELIASILAEQTRFDLVLSQYSAPSDGKYIFIELDNETQSKIRDINKQVIDVSKGIGLETIDGLPSKYPYIPHISIIKVAEDELESAYRALLDIKTDIFTKYTKVVELEITKEKRLETGFATFPVIRTISLQ